MMSRKWRRCWCRWWCRWWWWLAGRRHRTPALISYDRPTQLPGWKAATVARRPLSSIILFSAYHRHHAVLTSSSYWLWSEFQFQILKSSHLFFHLDWRWCTISIRKIVTKKASECAPWWACCPPPPPRPPRQASPTPPTRRSPPWPPPAPPTQPP